MQKRRIDVSLELITCLLSEEYATGGIVKLAERGIPADSEISNIVFTPDPNGFASIIIGHDSFEEIDGEALPASSPPSYSVDYAAIDLLKELVKKFEYHQYDMVEWTMAAAEVAIKAQKWLKENGHEIPEEWWNDE